MANLKLQRGMQTPAQLVSYESLWALSIGQDTIILEFLASYILLIGPFCVAKVILKLNTENLEKLLGSW